MACRPAHLGSSHPRGPYPTQRHLVARESLSNLECSQHVRSNQAGLPHRHEKCRKQVFTSEEFSTTTVTAAAADQALIINRSSPGRPASAGAESPSALAV